MECCGGIGLFILQQDGSVPFESKELADLVTDQKEERYAVTNSK